jgi:hypothetical protein
MLSVAFEGFGGRFMLEEQQALIPLLNRVGLQYELMHVNLKPPIFLYMAEG